MITPHVLRHTFASVAALLGSSELTISGLLRHGPPRYVRLDSELVIATDKVSAELARRLDGGEVVSIKEAKRLPYSENHRVLADAGATKEWQA